MPTRLYAYIFKTSSGFGFIWICTYANDEKAYISVLLITINILITQPSRLPTIHRALKIHDPTKWGCTGKITEMITAYVNIETKFITIEMRSALHERGYTTIIVNILSLYNSLLYFQSMSHLPFINFIFIKAKNKNETLLSLIPVEATTEKLILDPPFF